MSCLWLLAWLPMALINFFALTRKRNFFFFLNLLAVFWALLLKSEIVRPICFPAVALLEWLGLSDKHRFLPLHIRKLLPPKEWDNTQFICFRNSGYAYRYFRAAANTTGSQSQLEQHLTCLNQLKFSPEKSESLLQPHFSNNLDLSLLSLTSSKIAEI